MAEILAAKTEAERLEISWGMWRSARRMLTNLVTAEHSDWPRENPSGSEPEACEWSLMTY